MSSDQTLPVAPPSSVPPRLSSRLQKMPNGSLLITDVTTDDTGRYTCVAGNSCSIKDRVAQLYVVGECNTRAACGRAHSFAHRLLLIGTKLQRHSLNLHPAPVIHCDRLITATTSQTPRLSLT